MNNILNYIKFKKLCIIVVTHNINYNENNFNRVLNIDNKSNEIIVLE